MKNVCLKFLKKVPNKIAQFKEIDNELITERKNYKDILNKYEILQKEQTNVKSKLTAEKEKLQR